MRTNVKTQNCEKECKGTLRVCLFAGFTTGDLAQGAPDLKGPFVHKTVRIVKNSSDSTSSPASWEECACDETKDDGCVEFGLEPGTYYVRLPAPPGNSHWHQAGSQCEEGKIQGPFSVGQCKLTTAEFIVPSTETCLYIGLQTTGPDRMPVRSTDLVVGRRASAELIHDKSLDVEKPNFSGTHGVHLSEPRVTMQGNLVRYLVSLGSKFPDGVFFVNAELPQSDGSSIMTSVAGEGAIEEQTITGEIKTTTALTRTETEFTADVALWTGIRNSTDALSFNTYLRFMDWIFCGQFDFLGFAEGAFQSYLAVSFSGICKFRFTPFQFARHLALRASAIQRMHDRVLVLAR